MKKLLLLPLLLLTGCVYRYYPEAQRYVPPHDIYEPDGTIVFVPGHWENVNPPPVLVSPIGVGVGIRVR
jgi:hypothetical protein